MIILRKLAELKEVLSQQKAQRHSIGFIPTMGALHLGHISLIEKSVKENDFTVVSVFVNPTQFNNKEDLEKYPRTEDADVNMLSNSGADVVFFPSTDDIYPDGQKSEEFDFGGLENQMEGKFRPGHFDGVGTVVKRFFELIEPTKAYFGEKDFQQLRIIQQLVEIKNIPVQIVPVPIKREADGLAMSSRNMRLDEEIRAESPEIFRILNLAKSFLQNHSIEETRDLVINEFKKTKLELEYFEIADEETLTPVKEKSENKSLRAFVAVFAGDVRLIDNLNLS